jgi:hypothetical protein
VSRKSCFVKPTPPEKRNLKAEEVQAMIDALGDVTLKNQAAVYAAQTAYFELKEEEKAKVTDLDPLKKADDALRRLYIGQKECPRLDRTNLVIGTYCFKPYCWTDEHVAALADCGIDYIASAAYDKTLLDLLDKYGVKAAVTFLPGWWGGKKEINGHMAEKRPISLYEEYAAKFEDHPAICALDICDEPSTLDFPHIGKIVEACKTLFPGIMPYINLQNAGPGVFDFGARTYDEYIRTYVRDIDTDYISFDHYMYGWGVISAYVAYRGLSKYCRQSGRDMWAVLQVNNEKTYQGSPNHEQLRYQAYSAMGYGAKAITWACWTAGWWQNNVVDENGKFTEQYKVLKCMNADLRAFSPLYMWYDHVETFFIENSSSTPLIKDMLASGGIPAPEQSVFTNIKISDRSSAQAGFFEKKNKRGYALMLLNTENPWGRPEPYSNYVSSAEITFEVAPDDCRVMIYDAKKGLRPLSCKADGLYRVKLEGNNMAFITVEKN